MNEINDINRLLKSKKTKPKTRKMIVEKLAASPSKPSSQFIAFVNPTIYKTVKATFKIGI